ncbi:hypothetical protein NDU88_006496 [Pleurodeles waltl]|uniref:Uncharacterized protein n=1 Tax=Pleurodeles waltl TaxID=8319 RepID=A0AAV7SPX2_PLEWA|nr:hypothetical protein NDU88_006496 [Pleurodeles waltl]
MMAPLLSADVQYTETHSSFSQSSLVRMNRRQKTDTGVPYHAEVVHCPLAAMGLMCLEETSGSQAKQRTPSLSSLTSMISWPVPRTAFE